MSVTNSASKIVLVRCSPSTGSLPARESRRCRSPVSYIVGAVSCSTRLNAGRASKYGMPVWQEIHGPSGDAARGHANQASWRASRYLAASAGSQFSPLLANVVTANVKPVANRHAAAHSFRMDHILLQLGFG